MRVWSTFNPASPGTIGGTTPGAITGTTITGTTITATTKFLAANGTAAAPAYSFAGAPTVGMYRNSGDNRIFFRDGLGGDVSFGAGGAGQLSATAFRIGSGEGGIWSSTRIQLPSNSSFEWSGNTDAVSPKDIGLYRGAAGVLAQRLSTQAQENQIFGTYTDASNYERMALRTTAGSKVTLAAETAGTGADNLDVEVLPAGTGVVQFSNPQNGAGAASGTLLNAPSAGNPTEWLKVKVGANVRYIPCWA